MPAQFPYPQQSVLGGQAAPPTGQAPASPDATGAEGPPMGPEPTEPMAAMDHHVKAMDHHMSRMKHHMSKMRGGKKK
jgi:hypothetical protein